jgi:hypothetical protein
MHFICTPICTKFYSCKKWVLHSDKAPLGRSLSDKATLVMSGLSETLVDLALDPESLQIKGKSIF